jgi:hypothetical protein
MGGEEFFQGGPTSKDPLTFIGCSLAFPLVPEGVGVVGDPLGIGPGGSAEDPLHLAGDRRRLPDLPGIPGQQGVDEGLGRPCWTMFCLTTSGGSSW